MFVFQWVDVYDTFQLELIITLKVREDTCLFVANRTFKHYDTLGKEKVYTRVNQLILRYHAKKHPVMQSD